MPHHQDDDSEHGHGTSRHHALARMIVASPSSIALDTGGPDEFTFTTAGGFACFWGLCPYKQGKVAVAS